MRAFDESSLISDIAGRIVLLCGDGAATDLLRLCDDALRWRFAAVCVEPGGVDACCRALAGTNVSICAGVSGPAESESVSATADAARRAIGAGAAEIELRVARMALSARTTNALRDDIAAVVDGARRERESAIITVTWDIATLRDDRLVAACRCCAEAQADAIGAGGMVDGGAGGVDVVQSLRRAASPLRILATGDIHTLASARGLAEAGAWRIETRSGVSIMSEIEASRRA